ncbi:MAG: putative aminohydrolase SsnA [Tissierellia bacterium]|nr:putative aminohydrolase SsnA [Tissierellia bacterium]
MLLTNAKIITNNPERAYIENGAVLVKDNLIEDFGEKEELEAKYSNDHEVIDVEGRILMPGMINMHTHIYSSYGRGMIPSQPTRDFLEILENQWWKLDKLLTNEDTRLNAYTTLIESIRNGVTTVFDHHASPHSVKGSLETLADVAKTLGIRGDFCYEVSDRDGEKIAEEGIEENIDFIKKYNNDDQDMIHGHFGIHAPFTISTKTFEKIREAMKEVDAGYHIHVAEGIADQYDSLNKYGKRTVERLFDYDVLGKKSLIIHAVHASNDELQILRDTNTSVIHNPMSNMGNAVGASPVCKMLDMGIEVGLGTDAYTNDMFESVKVAKILQNHALSDPTRGFGEAYTLQFVNNPKIASKFFKKELGIIKKGAYADLITVDYKNYTPITDKNIAGHIIFGMTGRMVNDNMVNGKFIMRNREILTANEDEIFEESKKKTPEIWKNM